MKFIETKFSGLYIIKPLVIIDSRGFFKETFSKRIIEDKLDFRLNFCQDNHVFSNNMVLRGLHFQKNPYTQAKIVYVSNGKILDVVVDIRKDSKTYGKYFSIELSSENHKILFIPKGFAHGYLTLADNTCVNYKVDNYYNEEAEEGIQFNDKYLNIKWGIPHEKLIISEKDKKIPSYKW
tara:strand:+ start:5355 stop:5891 length:537 start_codon:yes stop_codon:yes gene_type:complete